MNAQLKSLKDKATAGESLLIDTVEMLIRNEQLAGEGIPIERVDILQRALAKITAAACGLNVNLGNAHWAIIARNARAEYVRWGASER